MSVARAGQRTVPVTPAPVPLRRYLNFAKLPDPALEVARRVLDDDDEFRRRVAEASDETTVGRGGWLFLHRPEGWRHELDELLQQAAAAEMAAKDERFERGAQRKLAGAEAALARAESAARTSADDAAVARAELHAQRQAAIGMAQELERLRGEVARLTSERAAAVRQLKEMEAAGVARAAELRAVRHDLRMLQAELSVVTAEPGDAAGELVEALDPGLDKAAVAAIVVQAAKAGELLKAALVELATLAGVVPATPGGSTSAEGRAERPRRRPVPLPPGILEDSPEAATHLVRTAGVLVLVDGYNISNAQWHGMAPADQRARLLDACGELHARFSVDVEVVFDGAGEEATAASVPRTPVRYQFTPEGVEADDVLLARAEEEPAGRPLLVVSSDRRVREGARRRGANVLGARQFLGLLRRAG